jgi:3-hydroxyisobutyrate dehydrogenase/glyoxylate/succinic semialdehyde reductase
MAAVTAYESGVALPVTNVAKEVYRMAVRRGYGEQDFSAIFQFLNTVDQS